MKLLNKLSAAMLSVALMAGFTSCTETAEYDAPSTPKVDQVYFSNVDGATVALNFEQDSFAVKVTRVKAGKELMVSLNAVSDSANIFTFPDSVVFEADSTVAYIPVTFDFANIVADTDYPISIELLGDEVTPYGASKVNLVVKYAPWSQWAPVNKEKTGTYTYTQFWGGDDTDRLVFTRRSLVNDTQQQFKVEGVMYGIDLIIDYDRTTGLCHVGEYYTGYDHATYGSVYVSDVNTYTGTSNYPSYFDEETGLFELYLVYYVSAGIFGYGYEYLQLDGYTQPDYSLKITAEGHYIDKKEVDNALIYIYKGADVVSYKYAIKEGALNEEEIYAMAVGIIDGSVESTEVEESGYHLFPLTEAGDYTVVAVSFDKAGEALSYNFLTFEFAPAGQSSPWESMGMATYREDLVTTFFKVENLVYEVEIEKNVETPGMYRLVNPYGAAYLYNEEGDYDDSKNYYMVINATDPAKVSIDLSYTGMNWTYGEFYVWSMAQYVMANGATEEDALPYWGKLENGVITFPGSALIIGMGEDYMSYGNKNGKFAVALPGYEIPEDEAAEEGGEESAAPARRATKQINNDVETLDKISLKGRPANADVVAKYLQNTIY